MTFNDGADLKGGRVSRRGKTGLAIGGGGGLVLLAVVLIGAFTGVDLTPLLGGGVGGGGNEPGAPLTECQTVQDANSQTSCRMEAGATVLDDYWSAHVTGYVQPQVVLFTDSTNTGCGGATSAVGPFYCPPDQTIYLDETFFSLLKDQLGGSDAALAQLYVLGHEWGHHIQNITGGTDGLDMQTTGPDSDGVRLELQADCYAGAWIGDTEDQTDEKGVRYFDAITDQQISDALSAASAVGDDHIQESTSGQVQPETWTHGSSEQRQRWFTTGRTGGPESCDTFAVPGSQL
jgi:predicted metalloprotease